MAEPSRRVFPALKSQPFETWQVGAVRLPAWFPRDDGDPFRAWIVICLNLDSGMIMSSDPGPGEELSSLLESAVSRAGWKWRSRPARVQVADVAWARDLDALLSPDGVAVEVQPELPELSGILANLQQHMVPETDPRPGPLTGAGVTLERLAAFARAAAGFLAASGWRHLNEEDRVRIEAPEVEPELRCFALDHDGGKPVPELSFFPDAEEFLLARESLLLEEEPPQEAGRYDFEDEDFEDDETEYDDFVPSGWSVELLKPWHAPAEDVDLWEAHGLPWVGDGLIPVAGRWLEGRFRRPDSRQLALFEGVLAALTALAEGDLDTGPWEAEVSTADGPVRLVLSLPDLLEPVDDLPTHPPIWRFLERSMRSIGRRMGELPVDIPVGGADLPLEPAEPETPEEHAEALIDRACMALGRRAVLLARQALEIWPDCAEAYNLLAGRAPDLESAGRLYELGVAAGERAIGPEAFAEGSDAAGHFWGLLETRPYMRARQGLADNLVERKCVAEAVEHFQDMLRLNPGDNQGVRHTLVNLLIALDRDEEAGELVDRYAWDTLALLEYPRALLRFRREGDSPEARKSLKRAIQANRFVPGLLLHTRRIPPPADFFSPGREEEAAVYIVLADETWAGTPGALDWLRQRTKAPARPKKKSKAGKRKKKRR
jgi:tetratricopeptide (TPR) repeat protein